MNDSLHAVEINPYIETVNLFSSNSYLSRIPANALYTLLKYLPKQQCTLDFPSSRFSYHRSEAEKQGRSPLIKARLLSRESYKNFGEQKKRRNELLYCLLEDLARDLQAMGDFVRKTILPKPVNKTLTQWIKELPEEIEYDEIPSYPVIKAIQLITLKNCARLKVVHQEIFQILNQRKCFMHKTLILELNTLERAVHKLASRQLPLYNLLRLHEWANYISSQRLDRSEHGLSEKIEFQIWQHKLKSDKKARDPSDYRTIY